MSKKDEALVKALLIGTTSLAGLAILASNPNCDRGCKNMAQHLAEHVLGDMLSRLLGA
jgi:hypothetical protein